MPLACEICKKLCDILIKMKANGWEAYQKCDCGNIRIDNEVTIRILEIGIR